MFARLCLVPKGQANGLAQRQRRNWRDSLEWIVPLLASRARKEAAQPLSAAAGVSPHFRVQSLYV